MEFRSGYPGRLTTLSSPSSPHPAALLRSMMLSRQGLAWQAYLFQLPSIPERLFAGSSRNADRVSKILQRGGQSPAAADRDVRAIGDPAILPLRSTGTEAPRCRVASAR